MAKLDFNETAQHSLEINNTVYPIAKRTGKVEQRLIDEYEAVRDELSEYESYKRLISILLGDEAFAEVFPNGEDESLDKMAQVAWYAQREFNAEIDAIEADKLNEQLQSAGVDKMIGTLERFNKQIDKTMSKAEMAKAQAKKRKK